MKNKTAITTRLGTAALITGLLMGTGSTYADHRNQRDYNNYTDFARVTHVEPVYRTVALRTPERQCWTETVAYERDNGGYRSHTAPIIGGLIGGAIGNELGHHKRNKQVGAVAGAILGASIARDLGHRKHENYTSTEYRDEERCEVRENVSYQEKITGYKVSYKYRGHTYHTRMDHHPGKKIKVAVNVTPVY